MGQFYPEMCIDSYTGITKNLDWSDGKEAKPNCCCAKAALDAIELTNKKIERLEDLVKDLPFRGAL